MAKGYWLARLDITDRETFAEYRKRNAAPIATFGGRFVVKGGAADTKLGPVRAENVVIEFDSYAQAVACFESAEYQAAAEHDYAARRLAEHGIVRLPKGTGIAGCGHSRIRWGNDSIQRTPGLRACIKVRRG